jgi:hypothetical protein
MEAISSASLLPTGSPGSSSPKGLLPHIAFGDGSSKRSLLPTGSLQAIKASRVKYLKNFMYQLLENV